MLIDLHLSNYESVDNIGTKVDIEGNGLQVDRSSLSEHQEKSTNFNNSIQHPTENQTPPADQHMIPSQGPTCYAALVDRTTPPPDIYERLNDQEPEAQEASSHTCEYTSHKTPSIARDAGIYQNPDHVLYVNVGQITLVGKVCEQ